MALRSRTVCAAMILWSMQLLQPLPSGGAKLGVWNVYQNGSRLLPGGCDHVCASQLRTNRLFVGAGRSNKTMSHRHDESRLATPLAPVEHNEYDGVHGEYFVSMMVGDKYQDLMLDTGSYLMWIQSRPCKPCSPGLARAIYEPKKSTTSLELSPDDPFCQSLSRTDAGRGKCVYMESYGDASISIGRAVRDTLTFQYLDSNAPSVFPGIAFGASRATELTTFTRTSGILGLANTGLGLSVPEQLIQALGRPNALSYCLPPALGSTNGFLYIGADSVPLHMNGTTTFVQGPSPHLQYIHVIGIVIDGDVAPIPSSVFAWNPKTRKGVSLVDTGSTFTSVTPEAYEPLRKSWRKALSRYGIKWYTSRDFKKLDTCYKFKSNGEMNLPILELVVEGGGSFMPRPIGNMFSYYYGKKQLQVCWSYFKDEEMDEGIALQIGDTSLQSIRMTHDFESNSLAWLYDGC